MSKEESNIVSFLIGLTSGLISGAAVGLLLAPKSGKELREEISSKTNELSKTSKEKLEQLKETSKEKLSEIQSYSKTQADKVAHVIQEKACKIGSKIEEFTKRGSDVLVQDEVH